MSIGPGAEFAGYRILDIAGRGGMGLVYKALQIRLDRIVALKIITPQLANDPGFRERFERESRLAASIQHPNVIPVHDSGEYDGQLFIVMRFVEGTDLRALISQHGRLEPRRAARIVGQVAEALDAAHMQGLVHRDVKPANILLAQDDHAYLTDFGLTKKAGSHSGVTGTGQWVGTLDYCAPEQIKGRPVDARADVYALGGVFYESLTGSVPFNLDSDVAKMFAQISEPPPSATAVVPGLPPNVDGVIARAMAKEPDERYPSAGDLGRAAVAAVENRVVSQPERQVAAGEAAPDAATRIGAAPTALGPTAAGAAALGPTAAGATAPLPEPGGTLVQPPPTEVPAARPPDRRMRGSVWLIVAALVILAGVGVAVALSSGGGGSGGGTGPVVVTQTGTTNPPPTGTTPASTPSTQPQTTTIRTANVTRPAVQQWLNAYVAAENIHDPGAIGALLTDDVLKVNGGLVYRGKNEAVADYRCRLAALHAPYGLVNRGIAVSASGDSATVNANYTIGGKVGGSLAVGLVPRGGELLANRVVIELNGGNHGTHCKLP